MSFGKLLRIAALLIVAYAVVHATQTFSVTPSAGSQFFALRAESEFLQHQSSGTVHAVGLAAPASHCGAAVVDAWHAKVGAWRVVRLRATDNRRDIDTGAPGVVSEREPAPFAGIAGADARRAHTRSGRAMGRSWAPPRTGPGRDLTARYGASSPARPCFQ